MINNEPVRGSVPPPWFWALPGIERLRLFTDGLLPHPPLWRFLGIRPAHVGPGSGTWTMPASACFQGILGNIEVSTLAETALTGVVMTTLPSCVRPVPLTLEINYFRPTRPQPGNLLARARVINASRFLAFATVEIEDPQGRQIAHGASHLQLQPVDSAIPEPPAELLPVEEPSYPTPDPYLRDLSIRLPPADAWEHHDGWQIVQSVLDGTYQSPFIGLTGLEIVEAKKGRIVATLPASEWFCRFSRNVAATCISSLVNGAGSIAGLTLLEPGQSFVGFGLLAQFYRPIPADGRPLRAEAQSGRHGDKLLVGDVHIYSADGTPVAWGRGIAMPIDSAKRHKRAELASARILATLLFTDIVGSTQHAERLGDAGWQALLDQHRFLVQEEVAQFGGTVVDVIGDGVFARFDAPVRALTCAQAIRTAVRRLGLEIRAGIHVGECEVKQGKLAGLAVHIAARIQAAAGAGEIWVSSTVKDLAAGSRARFEDRGVRELKGIPGQWSLFALAE